jgi:hypothetical protein
MPSTLASELRVLVQTAIAFGTWTTHPDLEVEHDSDGAGQVLGEAVLRQRFGRIAQPGKAIATVNRLDLSGRWVRILHAGAGSDVTVDGVDYGAVWHGVIQGHVRSERGADGGVYYGDTSYQAAGIAVILAQSPCLAGLERRVDSGGSDTYIDPGYLPPFNRMPGGDRSAATTTYDGATVYAHDRATPGNKWTAADVIRHLLALFGRPSVPLFTAPIIGALPAPVGTLTWNLIDVQDCLSYEPVDLDLNGRSVLDAINELINPRRGLTWTVVVGPSVASIQVWPTVGSAYTSGTYTLPASAHIWTPDLSAVQADDLVITEDDSGTADVIEIIGARPWVALTAHYDGTSTQALAKGWTSAEETSWNGATPNATSELVWRSWSLAPGWNCTQYNQTNGLRNVLPFSGAGTTPSPFIRDGSRSHNSSIASAPPATYELTRELPASPGFSTLRDGPRQLPVVCVYNTAQGWRQVTEAATAPGDHHEPMALATDDRPPTIIMGTSRADGSRLKGLIEADGGKLVATIGLRESAPLRVSWQRPLVSWTRDTPRILSVQRPEYEQWIALAGCVTSISPTGTPNTLSSDVIVRDDLPAMLAELALLRARYGSPARTASWIFRGQIDAAATGRPATYLDQVLLAPGDPAGPVIGAVITRRTRIYAGPDRGTRYETTHILPDIEAIR